MFYDNRGLPFRVTVRNPDYPIKPLDRKEVEKFVYDYFYLDDGSFVEKRSLDETGNVFLIVRRRVTSTGEAEEVAWYGIQTMRRCNNKWVKRTRKNTTTFVSIRETWTLRARRQSGHDLVDQFFSASSEVSSIGPGSSL